MRIYHDIAQGQDWEGFYGLGHAVKIGMIAGSEGLYAAVLARFNGRAGGRGFMRGWTGAAEGHGDQSEAALGISAPS